MVCVCTQIHSSLVCVCVYSMVSIVYFPKALIMEHCVCCLVASFFSSSVGHKVCVSVSKVFANPVCIGCLCFSEKGFVVAPLCVCVCVCV